MKNQCCIHIRLIFAESEMIHENLFFDLTHLLVLIKIKIKIYIIYCLKSITNNHFPVKHYILHCFFYTIFVCIFLSFSLILPMYKV